MTGLAPPAARTQTPAGALLRAARPRQWLKNLLVLAAPAAAGVVLTPRDLGRGLAAALAFTAVAAGCYLLNDVLDRHADALHPRKRHRPVASGALPVRLALTVAAALVLAGLLVALAVSGGLAAVVLTYVAVTVAYGLGLKGVAGLELVLVASGFVLRALGGAVADTVRVSGWFVVVVGAAALHLAASKRASELAAQPAGTVADRVALRAYTPAGLRSLRWATAAGMVFSYAGWTAVRPNLPDEVAAALSLVAMLVVLLRWVVRTDDGGTEAPEDVVLHDPVVRVAALVWAAAFAGSVLLV